MEYKEFALDIAKQAGKVIKQNFTLGMKKEWKGIGNPVTATDKEINRLVIDQVKANYPDHDVLGEEESSLENKSKMLWVCDPVDGTIPFSHGVPICTFSLALVDDGEPILGVTYDPFEDRMFFAEKGNGATMNGNKISVSDSDSIEGRLIDVETWREAKYFFPDLFGLLERADATPTRFASLVYPCSLVAIGEYISAIFGGNTAHDIAAIKVIVEEAGGKVTDLFGNEQRYDRDIKGAIVSNGKVHDQLVELVRKGIDGS